MQETSQNQQKNSAAYRDVVMGGFMELRDVVHENVRRVIEFEYMRSGPLPTRDGESAQHTVVVVKAASANADAAEIASTTHTVVFETVQQQRDRVARLPKDTTLNISLCVSCTCNLPAYLGLTCRHMFAAMRHRSIFLRNGQYSARLVRHLIHRRWLHGPSVPGDVINIQARDVSGLANRMRLGT